LIQILRVKAESAVEPGDVAAKVPAVNWFARAPNAAMAASGHPDTAFEV